MTTLGRAGISAVLNLVYADMIYDQFRRDIVVPHFMEVKDSGNDTCTWRVKFDGRTAGGAYAEGADMADADYDSHTRATATLNWAQMRKGAKVSGLAQAISQANGGGAFNGDVFMEEINDAVDALAVDVAAAVYGGDPGAGPVELAGAALAIDGSAGTFAGLATTTYGDWVSVEASTTAALLSVQIIRENLLEPVKQACGYMPEVVTVPNDLWAKIKALADEGASAIKEIRVNGQMVDVIAITGVGAVTVDGVPFINDRHCTSGTIYAWNFRFVHFKRVPATPQSAANPAKLVEGVKALTGVDVSIDDVQRRLRKMQGRLQPTVEILSQSGDAYKAQVKLYAQIAWAKRNAFGKLAVT